MEKVRELLQSPAGKIAATVLVIGAIGYLAWSITGFTGNSAAAAANGRIFIDSQTGETFRHTLQAGDRVPLESPFTGERTAYKAELCYWTSSGEIKEDPTPVLLNEDIGITDPTFCTDCDRLVLRHNPRPNVDSNAPPTREQFENR
ncbi:MAG: hypothetical protein AAGD32_08010 [Planctomycetota bacterium]